MSKLAKTCIFATTSAAVIEFNRFKPSQFEVSRDDNSKDIYRDYKSKDGDFIYHAEMHFTTDNNKDGIPDSKDYEPLPIISFGSMDDELNNMMKSAFKIETAFTKAPRFGVAQLVEKIEKEIEKKVIELVEYEGSGTWEEEASGDLEEEASGDFQHDASSSEKLWHLFY